MRALPTGLVALLLLCLTARAPAVPEADTHGRHGPVRLEGRVLHDAAGPFHGLGVSAFQALRRAKFDRNRFRSDLQFLASCGFRYVRVLSMVGGHPSWRGREIAPVTFRNRDGDTVEAWPDYAEQLKDTIDIAWEHGLRTELTLFADADRIMPGRAARLAHLDLVLDVVRGREEKVILLEVANEAWQNGFPGAGGIADLKDFGRILADRTEVLVALSAPPGQENRDLEELYAGSAADIATHHFTRDTRSPEGPWLPVIDVFRVNAANGLPPVSSNEPIGPGASVAVESDPLRLVAAAAYAWMSGLPMYVFHSAAGVAGDVRFEDTPGIDAFGHLLALLPPDIANWNRSEGREGDRPFILFTRGRPDEWATARRSGNAAPEKSDTGAIRNLSCWKDDRFYCLPVGIRPGGVELEARHPMDFEVIDLLTGEVISRHSLPSGQRIVLRPSREAVLVRGRYR